MERKEEREEGEEGRSRRWPVSAKDFGAAKWLRFRSPRQPSDHFVVLVCPHSTGPATCSGSVLPTLMLVVDGSPMPMVVPLVPLEWI